MKTKNTYFLKKIKKLSFEEKIELLLEILNIIKEEKREESQDYIIEYSGILKSKRIDPVLFQKKKRDEWEKRLSC